MKHTRYIHIKASLIKFKVIKYYNLATNTNLGNKILNLESLLTFLAYAIPLSFLLYVLYINFLPFGYNKTFTIDVGTESDTDSSKVFYLQPSKGLGVRELSKDFKTSRQIYGLTNIIFKPERVFKNAKITIDIKGSNVAVRLPYINFKPKDYKWNYSWNFSTQTNDEAHQDFVGEAFMFEGCMYFDGQSSLEFPKSSHIFEGKEFTVYTQWTPTNKRKDFQQIVGHYNWEFLQNRDFLEFRIGKMEDGSTHIIKYPIDVDTFFYEKHEALLIYKSSAPTAPLKEGAYMELYVDNVLVNRISITSQISKEYGGKNLSLGKSKHGPAKYFQGNICDVRFMDTVSVTSGESFSIERTITPGGFSTAIMPLQPQEIEQIELTISK